MFLPLVWYTSDLFYWFIYFGSFLLKSNDSIDLNNNNISANSHNKNDKNSLMKSLNQDYFSVFERISQILESFILKFGLNNIKLSFLFKTIGYICLFGAIGKFYLNFQHCIVSLSELVAIDVKNAK